MSTEAEKIREQIAALEKKLAAVTPVSIEEKLVKGQLTNADVTALAQSRYEAHLARPDVETVTVPWDKAPPAERDKWRQSAADSIAKSAERAVAAAKDARIAELEAAFANLQPAKP